jgi:hypothetical protein
MSTILGGAIPASSGPSGGSANEGIDFVAAHTGDVAGIWWYQEIGGPAAVTGILYDAITHAVIGSQAAGVLVAGAWNFIPFPAPITITAGYIYTASVFHTTGNIGFTTNGLQNHIYNNPLSGIAKAGRFTNGGAPSYPQPFASDLYGVDVEFTQTPTCPECPPCPPCPPTEGFFINLTAPGFANVVTGVGQCVIEALDQTPAGAPCRRCLLLPTQQIPWDNCGPCDEDSCTGQVALTIRAVYGSDTFPAPQTSKTWAKCSPRWWVARVAVSVTRCVPAMDQTGAPPGCDLELAAAIILENDRTAVRQAIACCLGQAHTDTPQLVGNWLIDQSVTVGELGGCAGVETEFLVGVQTCPCPS